MDSIATTRREPGSAKSRLSGKLEADYTAAEAFKNNILDSLGFAPDEIIGDGNLHRFKIDGKLNGWYVLHIDGRAAGSFGNWKSGETFKWKVDGYYPKLSDQQRADFLIEAHRQKLIRQSEEIAKHATAATKALYIWSRATPAPANHPYLLKKGIKPHGARLWRNDTLIIPLYNSSRELVNLQFINESGEKRFLSGGRKKACFHVMGSETGTILVCEGFATGASLFESTGFLTVVAFDAGNLKNVAINIKALYPSSDIVICGDNDLSGVGQQKAIEAALPINGKYIIPATPGQDWNDLLTMEVNHA